MKKCILIASVCNVFMISAMINQSSGQDHYNICSYPTITHGQIVPDGSHPFEIANKYLRNQIEMAATNEEKARYQLLQAKLLYYAQTLNEQAHVDTKIITTSLESLCVAIPDTICAITPDAAYDESAESLSSLIDTKAIKEARNAAKKARLEKLKKQSLQTSAAPTQIPTTHKAPCAQTQLATIATLTRAQIKKQKEELARKAQQEAEEQRRQAQRDAAKKRAQAEQKAPAQCNLGKSQQEIEEELLINAAIEESARQAAILKIKQNEKAERERLEAEKAALTMQQEAQNKPKVHSRIIFPKELHNNAQIKEQNQDDLELFATINLVLQTLALIEDETTDLITIAKQTKNTIFDNKTAQRFSIQQILKVPAIQERYAKILPKKLFIKFSQLPKECDIKDGDKELIALFMNTFCPRDMRFKPSEQPT